MPPPCFASLQDLGLLHAAQAFGYIAVTRLGLPANRLPFPLEGTKQIGEQLLGRHPVYR